MVCNGQVSSAVMNSRHGDRRNRVPQSESHCLNKTLAVRSHS